MTRRSKASGHEGSGPGCRDQLLPPSRLGCFVSSHTSTPGIRTTSLRGAPLGQRSRALHSRSLVRGEHARRSGTAICLLPVPGSIRRESDRAQPHVEQAIDENELGPKASVTCEVQWAAPSLFAGPGIQGIKRCRSGVASGSSASRRSPPIPPAITGSGHTNMSVSSSERRHFSRPVAASAARKEARPASLYAEIDHPGVDGESHNESLRFGRWFRIVTHSTTVAVRWPRRVRSAPRHHARPAR